LANRSAALANSAWNTSGPAARASFAKAQADARRAIALTWSYRGTSGTGLLLHHRITGSDPGESGVRAGARARQRASAAKL